MQNFFFHSLDKQTRWRLYKCSARLRSYSIFLARRVCSRVTVNPFIRTSDVCVYWSNHILKLHDISQAIYQDEFLLFFHCSTVEYLYRNYLCFKKDLLQHFLIYKFYNNCNCNLESCNSKKTSYKYNCWFLKNLRLDLQESDTYDIYRRIGVITKLKTRNTLYPSRASSICSARQWNINTMRNYCNGKSFLTNFILFDLFSWRITSSSLVLYPFI